MTIKLTETHLKRLAPYIEAKNRAEFELSNAVFLIAGKEFNSFSINEGMLIIQDDLIEEAKEVK